MMTFLTILHVLACVTLILIVLLQAGKGANMGAEFGRSSQTVFGSGGAGTFLGKMTAIVAIVFMLTSFALTFMVSRQTSSLMSGSSAPITKQSIPAKPTPALPPAAPSPAPASPAAPATK